VDLRGLSGGACPARGSGPISGLVNLAANGTATFTLQGTVSGLVGTLSMAASIAAPGGTTDQNTTNNAAADNDALLPNAAPTTVADDYTVNEDTALTPAAPGVLGNDSDGDADPITAVLVTGPSLGALTLNADGSFTYTPADNYAGPDSFTYRATDGVASSGVTTVTLTVAAVNDPPTITQPANLSTPWTAGPITVSLAGISAGGGEADTLTITAAASAPSKLTVSAVSGSGPTATFTVDPSVPQASSRSPFGERRHHHRAAHLHGDHHAATVLGDASIPRRGRAQARRSACSEVASRCPRRPESPAR
jgi:VCBS repeat-containing protein